MSDAGGAAMAFARDLVRFAGRGGPTLVLLALAVALVEAAALALVATVQFMDDVDDNGLTPDRAVPLCYMFKRPEDPQSDTP